MSGQFHSYGTLVHPSGIEIQDDVVEHSKAAIATWKSNSSVGSGPFSIDIIRGNALHISLEEGECVLGFDRIYIGASIQDEDLPRFKQLLKPGGILVGPGKHCNSTKIMTSTPRICDRSFDTITANEPRTLLRS